MIKLKPFLFLPVIILSVLLQTIFYTDTAFAGYQTGTGGGAAASAGNRFNWVHDPNGDDYKDYSIASCPDGAPGQTLNQNTRDIAWLRHNGGGVCMRYTGKSNSVVNPELDGNYDTSVNWDSDLKDTQLTGIPGPISYGSNGHVVDARGETVVAVWVKEENDYQPKSETSANSYLVYVEDNNKVYRDVREKTSSLGSNESGNAHAKWLYKNPQSETVEYSDTTAVGEGLSTKYSNKVNYKIEKITYKHTWKENKKGETKDHKYVYKMKGKPKVKSKTITYTVNNTSFSQIKYRPYNLNRGGLATTADIKDGFGDASISLAASTSSINPKVTDNSYIETLDINNDEEFVFKFTNKKFGMPASYDWATAPAGLNSGTYEKVNSNTYCNGKYSGNSDGIFRYNLVFTASTTSAVSGSGNSTSSLVYYNTEKGTEYRANDEMLSKTYKADNTFDGSDGWAFRSNLIGNYSTDHTKDTSGDYKNWWLNTYSELRYFEYGCSYKGVVSKANGVESPTITAPTYSGSKPSVSGYKISTDASNSAKNRGLYIAQTSASYKQPVLYGKWQVKTIAGDVI